MPSRYIKPRISKVFGKILLETPYNRDYVDALKYCIPQQDREFHTSDNSWSITNSYFACASTLVKAFFGDYLDATGGTNVPQNSSWQERWGAWQSLKDKRSKHEQSESPRGGFTARKSAFDTLYVTPNAPKQVVQAAYRALAAIYHPDRGGDPELMKAINAAYDELKQKGKAL